MKQEEYKVGQISLIKKTLGKNGKYYHYQSLNVVDNDKDVYWYKIDESYFNYHINQYKTNAIKIEYNEKGEIIYMEYELPQNNSFHKKKGCLMSVVFIVVILTIILLI